MSILMSLVVTVCATYNNNTHSCHTNVTLSHQAYSQAECNEAAEFRKQLAVKSYTLDPKFKVFQSSGMCLPQVNALALVNDFKESAAAMGYNHTFNYR